MKTPKLVLSVLACSVVVGNYAQNIPTHAPYVELLPTKEISIAGGDKKTVYLDFYDYFESWEPGVPLSEDENFYIARVPMKKRFVNTATQVDPTMTQDRKFSMWSYVDSQGGWSLPWVRVPGAYSDVTHRNGVANSGGLIFFDSWGGDNTSPTANVNMLVKKEGGKFKYVEKFVKFLRYYGLDGVGINPEGPVPQASALQDFFSQCREYAESIGWQFHVYWYGVGSNGAAWGSNPRPQH